MNQTNRTRVVIVDDEPTVRQSVALMLQTKGCDVAEFESGPEALTFLSKQIEPYDCVILDYSLPLMNGLQTLQRMRDMDIASPVIMCSGFSLQEEDPSQYQFWPNEILAKPFQIAELMEKINKLCGTRHS